ncbi:MAG: hypothetical protein QOG35_758 [Solirubrobacteraceae bacterium]|jgi:hypothetical protein|nr:hypothetical protein [Solirubrobacteraceae bacterium]
MDARDRHDGSLGAVAWRGVFAVRTWFWPPRAIWVLGIAGALTWPLPRLASDLVLGVIVVVAVIVGSGLCQMLEGTLERRFVSSAGVVLAAGSGLAAFVCVRDGLGRYAEGPVVAVVVPLGTLAVGWWERRYRRRAGALAQSQA